jgi:hypothetical protein
MTYLPTSSFSQHFSRSSNKEFSNGSSIYIFAENCSGARRVRQFARFARDGSGFAKDGSGVTKANYHHHLLLLAGE